MARKRSAVLKLTMKKPGARGHSQSCPQWSERFFSSASPADDPFVKVGDQVDSGQPLCLIEAMKIFNQIEAERAGTVIEILKGNGDPVEFGEPLFVLSE